MPVTTVDTQTARMQTGYSGSSAPQNMSFSEVMGAFADTGYHTAGLISGDSRVASMASASITGAAVAAAPQSAYTQSYMGTSSPFSSTGYGVPDGLGTGYTAGSYGSGSTYSPTSFSGSSTTDSFMQQDYLINKMADTNMQMIQIQAAIQQENRRWTTASNILKAKHDTEANTIRNFRVG